MIASLMAVALSAAPPIAPDTPLLPSQIALELGGAALGTTATGPTFEQFGLSQALEGRMRWGEFVLEGGVLASEPLGAAFGFSGSLELRLGWSNPRVAVLGGALVQWTPASSGVQPLPMLRIQYAPGPVVLTLGVFDYHGRAPAHFSIAYGPIELGYVAPLGGHGTFRLPIGRDFGVRFQVLGNSLLGARQLFFTVTAVYGREGGRWW